MSSLISLEKRINMGCDWYDFHVSEAKYGILIDTKLIKAKYEEENGTTGGDADSVGPLDSNTKAWLFEKTMGFALFDGFGTFVFITKQNAQNQVSEFWGKITKDCMCNVVT